MEKWTAVAFLILLFEFSITVKLAVFGFQLCGSTQLENQSDVFLPYKIRIENENYEKCFRGILLRDFMGWAIEFEFSRHVIRFFWGTLNSSSIHI